MIKDIVVAAAIGTVVLPAYQPYDPVKFPAVQVRAVDMQVVGESTVVALVFKGPVEDRTADQIEGAIKDTFDRGQVIAYLLLSSPGGSGEGGQRIGRMLRRYPDLTVLVNDTCSSACATAALVAGPSRLVLGPYARIGVHQAASIRTGLPAMEATQTTAQIMRDVGVTPSVINGMLRTPPEKLYWLTADDLLKMNVRGRYVVK